MGKTEPTVDTVYVNPSHVVYAIKKDNFNVEVHLSTGLTLEAHKDAWQAMMANKFWLALESTGVLPLKPAPELPAVETNTQEKNHGKVSEEGSQKNRRQESRP